MNSIELWEECLKAVFDLPASIIILTGDWKSGKTDFSCLLYEELIRLGIIQKGATNIETDSEELTCIQNMPYLKRWLFQDKISKLFIYDESITSTPKRRAMSKLNTDWLKHVIPELSKGKAKLLVITQELELTESVFYHPTFCRGIFKKIGLKIVVLNSPLLDKEVTFFNVPRTSIKFDPYVIAPFYEDEELSLTDMTEELRVAFLYANGLGMDEIGKQFNPKKHRYQVARLLRKFLKKFLKDKQVTSHTHRARDMSNIVLAE